MWRCDSQVEWKDVVGNCRDVVAKCGDALSKCRDVVTKCEDVVAKCGEVENFLRMMRFIRSQSPGNCHSSPIFFCFC